MKEITDRKKNKGQKTRDKIIQTACELFIENGYHATSTRQITDQLELAPSALYNHFSNKEEIFTAVIEKYHPWNRIPEAVVDADGDDVEELIRNASKKLLKLWGEKPEMSRLHLIEMLEFKGGHLPGIFERVFSKSAESFQVIQNRNPKLNNISQRLFVRAMIGLFFSYIMTDKVSMNSTEDDITSDLDYFADAYLQGVFAKESSDRK